MGFVLYRILTNGLLIQTLKTISGRAIFPIAYQKWYAVVGSQQNLGEAFRWVTLRDTSRLSEFSFWSAYGDTWATAAAGETYHFIAIGF